LHEDWLDFLAGEWNVVVTAPDGKITPIASAVFKRTGDTPALTLNAEGDGFSLLAVFGWHSDKKMFVETGYVGQGRYIREFTKVNDKELVGVGKGMDASGKPLRVAHTSRARGKMCQPMSISSDWPTPHMNGSKSGRRLLRISPGE
jgi:hypothetical protein